MDVDLNDLPELIDADGEVVDERAEHAKAEKPESTDEFKTVVGRAHKAKRPKSTARPMEVDTAKAAPTKRAKAKRAKAALLARKAASGAGAKAPRPQFKALSSAQLSASDRQLRRIAIPPNRYAPLKQHWLQIVAPIVEHLKLKVRFNLRTKQVELQSTPEASEVGALQRGADFVQAFALGFDVDDALALVRLDDLYVESFDITDVRPLKGDHLSRAVGRLAGKNGRTRFTIENVTKTRIVLANTRVHILGSYQNIQVAKRAVCNLILGSPPSKVYGNIKAVAERMTARL